MTRTRGGSRILIPGATDRLEGLIKGFRDEVRDDVQRLTDRVGEVDARVDLRTRGLSDDLVREVSHLNDRMDRFYDDSMRQIDQVRKELKDHERSTTADAARGAVQGVLQSTPVPVKANRLQLGTLVVVICALLINFIKEAPPVFRAVGAFFEGVKGLDGEKGKQEAKK